MRSIPVLYREYSRLCRALSCRFFTSWTSVVSDARVIKPVVAMITLHVNYAKRLLDVYILRRLSMSDRS